MSEICNPLVCDQTEIPVESLLRENLGYWTSENNRQPVVRAILLNEGADFYSCSQEISTLTLAKMLFDYDKKIRVVEPSEDFNENDCSTILSLDSLFRMAIAKTDGGCLALRIISSGEDSTLDCNNQLNPIHRLRSAFYINSDKTKTALSVRLITLEGQDFFSCNDNSGGVGLVEIIGRLFILKAENNYLTSLSYS